jgi:hypothetical protein
MSTLGDAGDIPYRERVLIAVPGAGGVQDPTTGIWSAAPAQTIYEGVADVQDAGAALRRDASGRLVESWDAVAFLPPAAEKAGVLARIRPDQAVTITWADGSHASAAVVRARRIDGAVELGRLASL